MSAKGAWSRRGSLPLSKPGCDMCMHRTNANVFMYDEQNCTDENTDPLEATTTSPSPCHMTLVRSEVHRNYALHVSQSRSAECYVIGQLKSRRRSRCSSSDPALTMFLRPLVRGAASSSRRHVFAPVLRPLGRGVTTDAASSHTDRENVPAVSHDMATGPQETKHSGADADAGGPHSL